MGVIQAIISGSVLGVQIMGWRDAIRREESSRIFSTVKALEEIPCKVGDRLLVFNSTREHS